MRRPVGRPRKAWLENVEEDIAELEIHKEYIHDRKKWRRNEEEVQSYRKIDYKPIIKTWCEIVFSRQTLFSVHTGHHVFSLDSTMVSNSGVD